MTGREVYSKNKNLLMLLSKFFAIFPIFLRLSLYNGVRSISGKLGMALRYTLLKSINPNIGDNVSIRDHVIIISPQKLSIGNNVSIHPYTYIDASGGISIGNNVSIACHSILISESHTWNNDELPIKYNPIVPTPIIIENDVWCACGVKIIGNCHIYPRVIIAAGAVVKGEIQSKQIVGGIPAKTIKNI
mgnify:CR=1 FL=1